MIYFNCALNIYIINIKNIAKIMPNNFLINKKYMRYLINKIPVINFNSITLKIIL